MDFRSGPESICSGISPAEGYLTVQIEFFDNLYTRATNLECYYYLIAGKKVTVSDSGIVLSS